jgi:hypothetical protein
LDKLTELVRNITDKLELNLKGFIEMIKDDVYYVEYTEGNIDKLLASLVEHGYHLGEEIWQSNNVYNHMLVDHSDKKVQLIQGNWLRYVRELNYPIHPVDVLIELLSFHK